jgi:hypothetical protein
MGLFNTIRMGSSAAGDYEVERSLRFNYAEHLERTPSSTGNQKVWTFSAWIKRTKIGSKDYIYSASDSNYFALYFKNDNLYSYFDPGNNYGVVSDREFRDVGAWFHIVHQVDALNTTQRIWINGTEMSLNSSRNPSNSNFPMNKSGVALTIGKASWKSEYNNMYLAEVHYSDGYKYAPSDFAETNVITGQWVPKSPSISYGTNGFYLNFSDNSGTTATTLGKDSSGNGNNFTPNNFSVAANLTNDSMPDTPTNNFCTLNPLNATSSFNFGEGNLVFDQSSNDQAITGTFFITSGKWYWEIYKNASQNPEIGICGQETLSNQSTGTVNSRLAFITNDGNLRTGASSTQSITGSSSGQTGAGYIRIAVDMDNKKIWFSDTSGNYFNSGNPATGANAAYDFSSHPVKDGWTPYVFMGTGSGHNCYMNFGQFDLNSFSSNIPAGFSTLTSANLPDPTILLPNKHFDTKLWSGNSSTQAITGLNFSPDLVWSKRRSASSSHYLSDTVRGVHKILFSELTGAEYDGTSNNDGVDSFDSNGFTFNNGTYVADYNASGSTYVGWSWNAGGSTVTNNDGSISSQVRANTTSGFSIVSFTPTAATTAVTIGHGLGVAPNVVIVKSRGSTANWDVLHMSLGSSYKLYLNGTNAQISSAAWGSTDPTSSVFTFNPGNQNNNAHIAYCFSEVAGYSKFGSYTGNGNTNGPYVFTGFRPALIISKTTNHSDGWQIWDNKRDPHNLMHHRLHPEASQVESTSVNSASSQLDFYSNGFKWRGSSNDTNGSGDTYIYLAFAESPFKYSRAR